MLSKFSSHSTGCAYYIQRNYKCAIKLTLIMIIKFKEINSKYHINLYRIFSFK